MLEISDFVWDKQIMSPDGADLVPTVRKAPKLKTLGEMTITVRYDVDMVERLVQEEFVRQVGKENRQQMIGDAHE